MTNYFRGSLAVLGAAFLASGCVSNGTFNKMEAAKNDEIAALQQQKAALEKDKLTARQQIDSLKQENASMRQQVGSLEQQSATLIAANQERQQQYERLLKGLAKEVESGQLQVRQFQNMLSVDLAEQIFFDSGRSTLKKEGKDVLKKVGEALRAYDNKVIRVVGHTDNVPVAKSLQSTFASNWELSVDRATNVVRFLQEVGIPPQVMIPAGRGEYDPIASNDTPEGRQKNRRIEILLIDKGLVNELSRPTN